MLKILGVADVCGAGANGDEEGADLPKKSGTLFTVDCSVDAVGAKGDEDDAGFLKKSGTLFTRGCMPEVCGSADCAGPKGDGEEKTEVAPLVDATTGSCVNTLSVLEDATATGSSAATGCA